MSDAAAQARWALALVDALEEVWDGFRDGLRVGYAWLRIGGGWG